MVRPEQEQRGHSPFTEPGKAFGLVGGENRSKVRAHLYLGNEDGTAEDPRRFGEQGITAAAIIAQFGFR